MTAEFANINFGQYQLLEQLDDNGIIHTYRAYQESLKRFVAVHLLSPKYRNDAGWSKALVKGAEIAATYEHANIVPIFDYSVHDGIDYVVLRLLEGGTLLKRLEQGPLPLVDAITVIRQIASALDYIHARGGCHGDPATVNIFFDLWGTAYLADFYLQGLLQTSSAEMVAGVFAFMAPERMLGQPPSALTDQYALAGVAYSMLTGKGPWDKPAHTRLPETIVLPQIHRPEIPTTVNDVLWRALARDPMERYPTVIEFARQFEEALKMPPPHLFISYSRRDTDYAEQLKAYLGQNGLPVWIDDQIEHGDQWFNQINDAIKNCGAFLVIMSPDAEQSEWVQKEILLAKRYQKPIFPLLLRGAEFAILIDLQYADVRSGILPETDFHRRVSRAVYGN